MRRILQLLIMFLFATVSHSQVNQEWVSVYHGGGFILAEQDRRIALDSSGNVYVAANTGLWAESDFAVIKYNPLGVQQWVQTYDGPGADEDLARAIAADAAGNVYVAGASIGSGTGRDFATIKYNASGGQEWVSRYNGTANTHDGAFSIDVDPSGNVYVTGESDGSGTGTDFATIKYNSNGVEQWVRRYNGSGNENDFGQRIRTDPAGNAYVTGAATGTGSETDYVTIMYSPLGFEEWVRVYNGPGNSFDWPFSLAIDASGNVHVTGQSWGTSSFSDYATIKYNSNGDQQWVQRYDRVDDIAYSVACDISGNVYVTGGSFDNATDWDFTTIKYNSFGNQQWIQHYNGPNSNTDIAYAMVVDGMGNVYVTGKSFSGAEYNFSTVKYNSDGVQQWFQGYTGSGLSDEVAYSVALDHSNNVYVAGNSQATLDELDYTTIRYTQEGSPPGGGWAAQESNTQVNLYGVHFNDTENGIVVGASGTILRTADGGSSWLDISMAKPDTFFSVHFSDNNTGIIVGGIPSGGGAVILRTTDGGQSWNEQTAGTAEALRSIFCLSNDEAIAVGESGTILRTADAGATWNPQPSCYLYDHLGVTFVDNTTGFFASGLPATGNGGPIGVTLDGGVTWGCAPPPGPVLTSVAFADQSTGFIAGEFGVILKTTDGGTSWNVLSSGVASHLNGVSCTDPNIGTVVGQSGTVLRSTDGGVGWFAQASGTAVSLNGVFFFDNQEGWTVGDNGTILHTTGGGVSSVEETADLPRSRLLHQNYPNPFNPSTTISYGLPTRSHVTLTTYNMLGEELVTLVDEVQDAGVRRVEWNASSFPSGVYFYRIQARSLLADKPFSATGKMALVK